MNDYENTAAVGATTTTDKLNNDQAVRTSDLTLRPVPGNCWALSIDGRPALIFNHLYHAAEAMKDIHGDLADGFALWGGDFDHVTAEYLDQSATGSVRGPWRKAGAEHRVCKGWG